MNTIQFENPSDSRIRELLRQASTIAVVGLSDKAYRPSHGVARALQRFGYEIVPINPRIGKVLGASAFPDLAEAKAAGFTIDIVDVFRSPEHVEGIVDACIELDLPMLWLQEGVIAPEQALRAVNNGVRTVMDRCIYKEHVRLLQGH